MRNLIILLLMTLLSGCEKAQELAVFSNRLSCDTSAEKLQKLYRASKIKSEYEIAEIPRDNGDSSFSITNDNYELLIIYEGQNQEELAYAVLIEGDYVIREYIKCFDGIRDDSSLMNDSYTINPFKW